MELHELPWDPVPPQDLPRLLAGVDGPWWLAGGWAIDAHLGRMQLMIDDTDPHDGATWVYRRDARVRRPVASLAGPASDERRAVLAPEVQLLQKSKGRRSKDQADFEAAAPFLDDEARTWLHRMLDLVSPGHPWVEGLS